MVDYKCKYKITLYLDFFLMLQSHRKKFVCHLEADNLVLVSSKGRINEQN